MCFAFFLYMGHKLQWSIFRGLCLTLESIALLRNTESCKNVDIDITLLLLFNHSRLVTQMYFYHTERRKALAAVVICLIGRNI